MGMGNGSSVRTVRIFLASPSADTLEARARVVQVVNEIGADPLYAAHVRLDLRRWDDPARPVACDRAGNPQQDIVQQVGSPGDCELVIGIFAHTMGGTLPKDRFSVPAGRDDPWHCSEWEVAQGLGAQRSVWVFHDQRPLMTNTAQAKRASLAVSEYIEDFDPLDGSMRSGFNPFSDLDDLASKLRYVLRVWLSTRFIRQQGDPSPSNHRRLRELSYLDGLTERLSQHELRYVPLSGEETPEQRLERVLKDLVIPSDFVLEAFEMDGRAACTGHASIEPVVYQDVLEAYRALPARGEVRRLAVLGEPGAGKSFSLGRIACELARKARADETQPVPVMVALGLWTDADETLDAFLVRRSAPFLADDLQTLRREGRLLLLLDAVNEIPPGQRSAKAAEIAELAGDESIAAMVLSCRARDFEVELKSRLAFDTLKLLPLQPPQVHELLRRTLVMVHGEAGGARLADEKFWNIVGRPDLQQVWQIWKKDGASWNDFWLSSELVMPRCSDRSVVKRMEHIRIWGDSLSDRRSLLWLAVNPFLLTVMMQLKAIPPNRAQLFAGFLKVLHERERRTCEKRGDAVGVPTLAAWRLVLVQVAEALQRVDGREGDDGARTALARTDWPVALDEAMLVFSIDASVLQVVDGELRFTHQLLQESLAADVLLDASRSGRRPASDFWPEQRGWARTGWEVVAEIAGEACGADEAARLKLIEWLSTAVPKVAADVWKHLNRPALPAELRQAIADQWCPRLTDNTAEPAPEARAAIGEWLGALDLDRRPGTGLRADGVPDIEWVLIDDENEPFYIGRYLVTNRQWQAFIDDGGYETDQWWQGLAERMAPITPTWSEPTAPRETVSWYEAMAYCRWLSVAAEQAVRLPTEAQWARAARDVYGEELDAKLENEMFSLGRTTVVGSYQVWTAGKDLPQDLGGNVWELCSCKFGVAPELAHKRPELRVVRGGSWADRSLCVHPGRRGMQMPDSRSTNVGLRLVRAVPHSEP